MLTGRTLALLLGKGSIEGRALDGVVVVVGMLFM
jgi:hypothetical protein